jgi:hypothetical protein
MNEITYKDIENANATLKTTPIKGKDYAEVNQRIKAFRMLFPTGKIVTNMISNENGICIFRAEIYADNETLLGTGTAYEKENSTFINKTSYIENCETSAVGRALGMCGLGIDTSIASYEEVANAVENQNKSETQPAPKAKQPAPKAKQPAPKENRQSVSIPKTPREKLIDKLHEKHIDVNAYAKEKGLSNKTTTEEFNKLLAELEG